jgi:hypothetical protein
VELRFQKTAIFVVENLDRDERDEVLFPKSKYRGIGKDILNSYVENNKVRGICVGYLRTETPI